ncbi:MAG TPA: glycosyltransferase [Smithellaceae bacterium]|nr:glycosyltransferase [Smithellaceae bacterium]
MDDFLKKYRNQYRIWKNNRRLRHEDEFYQQQLTRLGLQVPDEKELRRELNKRFPLPSAKAKGNLNIIALYHHYNWENFSLRPSLAKFGKVRHYDWFSPYNPLPENWHKQYRAAINKDLINQVNKWITEENADVIFMYIAGEIVEPITLQIIRNQGVPMINLTLNDKEHFVGRRKNGRAWGARDICRYFDLCWTSTEDALKKYVVEGALPYYQPEGANPEIHKPYDLEKTIDVSFVGQCYGNRADVIKALQRQGINVAAYGAGWPNGSLSTEDMIKMYSRSKINLGFGGVAGLTDTFCLKGRDFEIPMSGGLYCTEDHPELARFFRPGEEIITYRGTDDLIIKIRNYLDRPAEAETIRKKGHERALREHSWEARFEKIFRILGILQ